MGMPLCDRKELAVLSCPDIAAEPLAAGCNHVVSLGAAALHELGGNRVSRDVFEHGQALIGVPAYAGIHLMVAVLHMR